MSCQCLLPRSLKALLRSLVVVAIGLIISTVCCVANAAERPHVVIILADDMGYGDPGCYNPKSKCPTPSIDRLAEEGIRFSDAHAAGAWCTPSRYGLLTGRYAFRTSLGWQREPVIADEVLTIADSLKAAGYQTAMVGKWHLGFVGGTTVDYESELRGGPCDRGFDTFFGLPASLDIPDFYWIHNRRVTQPPTVRIEDSHSPGWSPIQGRFWRGGLRAEDFVMDQVLDEIANAAVTKIRELATGEQPFLLYVPLTSPHTPWLPAEQFAESNQAGLYSQFVHHTDAVVGQILESLRDQRIADDTLVIFASDNGPVWYGSDTERFGHDATGGWRGLKGDVWEAGHRVPFIVRWPRQIPAGQVSAQLISFVDVHATVAELVGAAKPETAVDSHSFAKVWLGEQTQPVRRELIPFQSPIALRSGNWKLITRPGSAGFLAHEPEGRSPFLQRDELNPEATADGGTADGQLYDLASDPTEQNNLWSRRSELVQQLTKRLQQLSAAED